MRAQSRPWLVFAALAVLIAALLWRVDFYRHRFVRSDRDLFRFLPSRDNTIFYINVAALRRAGVLHLFAGTKTAEEPEYQEFLRQTQFDYTKDIDAVAGAAEAGQISFIVRGRFDWNKLCAYAASHGGDCTGRMCEAPSSRTGRWVSFAAIQPNVMALALSADRSAAKALRPPGHPFGEQIPDRPVWARLSQRLLKHPADLPLAIRLFAISLQFTNPVVVSLAPAGEHSGQFKLELDAECASAAMADTIRKQLELDTNILKLELEREHAPVNAADLTGLLTEGAFQVVDKRVIATWPVRKQLLKALE